MRAVLFVALALGCHGAPEQKLSACDAYIVQALSTCAKYPNDGRQKTCLELKARLSPNEVRESCREQDGEI